MMLKRIHTNIVHRVENKACTLLSFLISCTKLQLDIFSQNADSTIDLCLVLTIKQLRLLCGLQYICRTSQLLCQSLFQIRVGGNWGILTPCESLSANTSNSEASRR